MLGSIQEGIYHFTLGQRLLEKASKELNEDDRFRARDIQYLRERVEANRGTWTVISFRTTSF